MNAEPTPALRILVVDDDPDTLRIIEMILERLGLPFSGFTDPEESLRSAAETKFDLALLDIMMPKLNGYQLLEKLRALPGYQDLPVIYITAKDKDDDCMQAYKTGADYYIPKPFTAEQLEYGLKIFLPQWQPAA